MFDSGVAKAIAFVATVGGTAAMVITLPRVSSWAHDVGPMLLTAAVALAVLVVLLLGSWPRSAQSDASGDDQALLDRLLASVPATRGAVPLLRDGYPVGSRFSWEPLRALERLVLDGDAPTMQFKNSKVEERRRAFVAVVADYLSDLRSNSFKPEEVNADRNESYVPTDWPNYREVITSAQVKSMAVAGAYDDLVSTARRAGLSVREPAK